MVSQSHGFFSSFPVLKRATDRRSRGTWQKKKREKKKGEKEKEGREKGEKRRESQKKITSLKVFIFKTVLVLLNDKIYIRRVVFMATSTILVRV